MRMVGYRLPNWLRPGREHEVCEGTKRSILYHRRVWRATPPWLSDSQRGQMKEIYDEARRQRKLGVKVHTDHIVPLASDLVCGLHVPWNLQNLPELPNLQKSNLWWPDCPFQNEEMFHVEHVPHQLKLL